jgi:hypothetical protein
MQGSARRWGLVSCGLLAVSLSAAATAGGCFSASPNLVAQGDDYFAIDGAVGMTSGDRGRVQAIFKALDRSWQGSASGYECRGTEGSPRVVTREADVEAQGRRVQSSTMRLTAELRFARPARTTNRDFEWSTASSGSVIYAVKDNGFSVSEKRRVPNAGGRGSRLLEHVSTVSLEDRALTVETTLFVNGYLADSERWSLKPRATYGTQ